MPRPTLHHGEWFGKREVARDVGGFALSIKSADPEHGVERHTHEDAHFILLLDGHYHSTARGAGHLNAEPALIYNPPGTTHRDTFPERAGRFLGLSVSRARFEEATQLARPIETAERIWEPSALAIAHELAALAAHDAPPLELEALCLELVASFTRVLETRERRPPPWLSRALEQLHGVAATSAAAVSVSQIAREAAVHPVYFARAFRRFYGCTPGDYVRRLRVERAARAIRETERALAEIALECGFVDQAHLTRSFTRVFAISPARYRRRMRGEHPFVG